jgi:hypothetical protein
MPEFKTDLTRASALEMVQCILSATGEKSYRAAREQVRSALEKVWPDVRDTTLTSDPKDARPITFTEKQLRAMGEGFLSLLSQPISNGADMAAVARMAANLGITRWLNHFLKTDDLPGLEFPSDDEPEIGD